METILKMSFYLVINPISYKYSIKVNYNFKLMNYKVNFGSFSTRYNSNILIRFYKFYFI